MPRSMRKKFAGALMPVTLVAIAAAVALPATSGATPMGSQTVSANVNLDCLLPALSLETTIPATLTGTAPVSVAPGDAVTLTGVTTTLQVPANLSASFQSLGATSVSGSVTQFNLDVSDSSTPVVNAANPALPFGPVAVTGAAITLPIPNTGPFTVALGTASAAGTASLSLDTTPAFSGDSSDGFTVNSGAGVVSSATGTTSTGHVGPLAIVCNAPASTLGTITVANPTTTSSSTATTASTTSTTSHTTTISTTSTTSHTTTSTVASTSTTSAQDTIIPFSNWVLSGSLTPKKLNQKITLPSGATFNGTADLTSGKLSGDIKIPAFKASVKILGIPTTVGISFTESGPATGTITPSGSNLVIAATAKANIGITAVGILGINIPTTCTTASPVSFALNATEPALSLLTGVTFTGTTTLPTVKCGGILGGLLSPVLTALFSGPNNAYALAIAPAATS